MLIFAFIFILIISVSIFLYFKFFVKYYDKISIQFYEKVIEKYIEEVEYNNISINSKSFINLNTYENLNDMQVDNLISKLNNHKIRVNDDNQEISISIKFNTYHLNSLRFYILIYKNKNLIESREYVGKYQNKEWIIDLLLTEHIHKDFME